MAVLDSRPADLQTVLHLLDCAIGVVKAMHRAPGWLVIQSVEFFVQKCKPRYLSSFQSLVQVSKHLSRHVVDSLLVFVDSEELSHLLLSLIVGIEIHLSLLLQLLPRFVLVLFPVGLLLVSEKGRFRFFMGFLFFGLIDLELQFSFLLNRSFLFKQVEVRKVDLRSCMLPLFWLLGESALLIGQWSLHRLRGSLGFARILFVLVEVYWDWLWHYKC